MNIINIIKSYRDEELNIRKRQLSQRVNTVSVQISVDVFQESIFMNELCY